MICAHSEASNRSLGTRSEVKVIAVVIMLHLCESQYEREVDTQSMVLEFMIVGVLTLTNKKHLIRRT